MTTYAERKLRGLGFREEHRDQERAVVLTNGRISLWFGCACPSHPSVTALGCPLHHNEPGDSWPVHAAVELMEAHRRSEQGFPRYQMVVSGEVRYYGLGDAARAYDSGHVPVEFGRFVLERDGSERPLTREDRVRISDLADELSAAL